MTLKKPLSKMSVDPFSLTADHLYKTIGKRPILLGVNLYLNRGEVVGLLGPNGAGKTTCFALLTGFMHPDRGKVFLDQTEVTDFPLYQRARLGVGYLPQESSIFRGLSVEQNILAILEIYEKDRARREEQLDALLDEFAVSHLRQSSALALSGGERRRVEMARALASNPKYLLLDEPFAGIDPISIGDIKELILQLKDRGIGVLITDHNVRETLELVDRAYIINGGQTLMEGTPEEIIAHKDVRRIYLGERFSL